MPYEIAIAAKSYDTFFKRGSPTRVMVECIVSDKAKMLQSSFVLKGQQMVSSAEIAGHLAFIV